MPSYMNAPSRSDSRTPNERLATGLGWFSVGLGLVELLAARSLTRTLGMEGHEGLVRAYGARELATGVAILASHDPTPWIWGRVGGDALDLATLATGLKDENGEKPAVGLAMAAVLGVTALDILCAQGLTSQKSLAGRDVPDYGDRTGFPMGVERSRGAARDFVPPADFRTPDALRSWTS